MWLILAALLPEILLFYYIYRKDRYAKEPTNLLVRGFLFGVLSALLSFAFSSPMIALGVVPEDPVGVWDYIRLAVFGAGIPEELAKFVMLCLLLYKNPFFDEYFDGVVYAVTIGLGFAGFENILYLVQNYSDWVSVGAARAVTAVPAHFFFAIIMGFFMSMARFGSSAYRMRNLAYALVLPILAHLSYDALLMVSSTSVALFGILSIVFVYFFIHLAKFSKHRISSLLAMDDSRTALDEIDDQSPVDPMDESVES
ncbi:MAG: PrsW family glutamic-type intramembrane protease [Bacteroidales bacterium]|nr:PrsW family glutamic-type intramembrane protease [Bacteroidales bacterium]